MFQKSKSWHIVSANATWGSQHYFPFMVLCRYRWFCTLGLPESNQPQSRLNKLATPPRVVSTGVFGEFPSSRLSYRLTPPFTDIFNVGVLVKATYPLSLFLSVSVPLPVFLSPSPLPLLSLHLLPLPLPSLPRSIPLWLPPTLPLTLYPCLLFPHSHFLSFVFLLFPFYLHFC